MLAGKRKVRIPNSVRMRKLKAVTIPSLSYSLRIASALALASLTSISATVYATGTLVV
jgi:hypothetical protein